MLLSASRFFLIFIFISFVSCENKDNYLKQASITSDEVEFFKNHSSAAQKKEVFGKSLAVYKGSPICEEKCREICKSLFSSVKDDCYKLPSQQIYQIDKLHKSLIMEDFSALQDINVFDLKVFFSLSGEPLFRFFKTLDSVSVKKFLLWIVENWQVAIVFYQEDKSFLFLEIFLNKLNQSPINSLKEELEDNKTFVDLAWLRNNDHALFWLDDYLNQKVCLDLKDQNLRSCVLSQYCLISQNLQPAVQLEFLNFERLKGLLKTEDLRSFCPESGL